MQDPIPLPLRPGKVVTVDVEPLRVKKHALDFDFKSAPLASTGNSEARRRAGRVWSQFTSKNE